MKFSGLEKIDVYVVSVVEGIGTEENPCRIVKYYMTEVDDGKMELLFKKDSIEAGEEE